MYGLLWFFCLICCCFNVLNNLCFCGCSDSETREYKKNNLNSDNINNIYIKNCDCDELINNFHK